MTTFPAGLAKTSTTSVRLPFCKSNQRKAREMLRSANNAWLELRSTKLRVTLRRRRLLSRKCARARSKSRSAPHFRFTSTVIQGKHMARRYRRASSSQRGRLGCDLPPLAFTILAISE